jgi:hypothetical protein
MIITELIIPTKNLADRIARLRQRTKHELASVYHHVEEEDADILAVCDAAEQAQAKCTSNSHRKIQATALREFANRLAGLDVPASRVIWVIIELRAEAARIEAGKESGK